MRRPRAVPTLWSERDGRGLSRSLPAALELLCLHRGRTPHGGACMRVVFFCHAFTSCWNNGNAHFLRGVARELSQFGHHVVVYEPAEGWSRLNAILDGGIHPL